jgi:hypothetical protein
MMGIASLNPSYALRAAKEQVARMTAAFAGVIRATFACADASFGTAAKATRSELG